MRLAVNGLDAARQHPLVGRAVLLWDMHLRTGICGLPLAVPRRLSEAGGNSRAEGRRTFTGPGRHVRMRIALLIDPSRIWHWHVLLARVLVRERGHVVIIQRCLAGPALPAATLNLIGIERRLLWRQANGEAVARLCDVTDFAEFDQASGVAADLVIDLTGGSANASPQVRTLRPLYDGQRSETAAITAILARRQPSIQVHDSARPAATVAGFPAVDRPDVLARSLDSVFSRMGELLLQVVAGRATPASGPAPRVHLDGRDGVGALQFFSAAVAGEVAGKVARVLGRSPRWTIGWRHAPFSPVRQDFRLALDAYHGLADDAHTWYADPFVRWHDGRYHVLCEAFDERRGKGVISAFVLGPDGTASKPQVVLERP